MNTIKIVISLIILLTLATTALGNTALDYQVQWYEDNFDEMTTYQRGDQEQTIAKLVLQSSYTATNSNYRWLHRATDYFEEDLLGRRTRMFRYILTHQTWETPILQAMANELFVVGCEWEAITILNYIVDGRLPGNHH